MASSYWTIALQTVNFLVLVWLLQRFLYRPVLAVIENRRTQSERALTEAAQAKTAADEARQSLERERATIGTERDRLLEKAASEAARERDALIEKARNEAQTLETETRKQMERERQTFQATIVDEAAKVAVEIARRLLTAATPAHPVEPFLDRAVAAIESMPKEARARLILPGEAVTLVAATPLTAEEETAAARRLTAALGAPITVSFAVSADLIAGIELRFPHATLRHDWRADLDSALKELASHERSATSP